MDIIYFIKALLKKKWWIIGGTFLAIAAAFFFTMGRPRLYSSTAQISTGFTIKDQITLRDEGNNIFEADVKFENAMQTMTSPLVISLLSYQLLLHDLTSPKPFVVLSEQELKSKEYLAFNRDAAIRICRQKMDSLQMLSSYDPEERKVQEYMKLCKFDYEGIRKMLNVNRVTRTDYIDIAYRSENPEQSAFVVNTLYNEFIRYYRSLRSERTVENVETFAELVNQKKTELDAKVEALRMYKTSEGVLNIEAASGSELGLISQLEKALLDERASLNIMTSTLATLNTQIANASSGKVTYGSANANASVVSLRKEINRLNDEKLRSGTQDDDLDEKIKQLRKQLQQAESALPTTSTGVPSSVITKEELIQRKETMEADINASQKNIAVLEQKIRSLKGSLGSYANKEATVGTLQQEVQLAQDEYNRLKEKMNSAIDNRTVPTDNFRQTLKGQPAFKPESSKRAIIMGMTGMAVFFLTSLGIIFKELFDTSIKSPSNFLKSVDLKLIATVNHADLHKYSILEVLQANENSKDIRKRQNSFRELLRKLRFEMEKSGKSIFLFTSTESQQGKTTLVQAVAYSLSLSNKKVLVIDTNFCNNDLTVALSAKPTLETFSMPRDEYSYDKVEELITTYAIENIGVIGCKGGDYTPTEILPPNHLLNYLHELKEHYDFILMEGAPLNDYTDSKELEKYAESVVAIFNSNATLKQNDKDSIDFLHSLNDKFLGAVLNNISDDYLEL
ncbi:exopolysaccharide transport family protein [Chitinophaga deserti]|uniref:exopolysaccharide transport family protein n=1 Tax=Chitinophaga deserti TaxID=2164099 RepID=UPI000D6C5FA5|nr:AAA family ATPase [Chitinophaga deserti]